MNKNNFSAPGKLIISGEHAVVYGHPALSTAVGRRLTVNKNGKITSNIPIGAGMGSSAALAVAQSALKIGSLKLEEINDKAYEMEKIRHGNPSGADNTVVTYGGFLWFRKESENFKTFKSFKPGVKLPEIYILNTGRPAETTREMVEKVARLYRTRKKHTEAIFNQIEEITKEFLTYFLDSKGTDPFKKLIKRNEKLLEKLGIVSLSTKKIIRQIEKMGGAAKVSGAGGTKKASGILMVYMKDEEKLKDFAKSVKLELMKANLGEEGVRIEKEYAS